MHRNKEDEKIIRNAIVGGLFYPLKKDELRAQVKKLLDESAVQPDNAFAIVTPHAGYEFSGKCLADAFKAASKRNINDVVLIGPMHRDPEEKAILPESTIFETPMGKILVNRSLVEEFLSYGTLIEQNDVPHLEEHCLEVQLPFIQYIFPQAKIVPVLYNPATLKKIRSFANILKHVFIQNNRENVLFVITSNISRYTSYTESKKQAENFLEQIKTANPEPIYTSFREKKTGSCGMGGILSFLYAMEGEPTMVRTLSQHNSYEILRNEKHAVHYAGIAFYQEDKDI